MDLAGPTPPSAPAPTPDDGGNFFSRNILPILGFAPPQPAPAATAPAFSDEELERLTASFPQPAALDIPVVDAGQVADAQQVREERTIIQQQQAAPQAGNTYNVTLTGDTVIHTQAKDPEAVRDVVSKTLGKELENVVNNFDSQGR